MLLLVKSLSKHKILTTILCTVTLLVFISTHYTPQSFCLSQVDAGSAIQSAESELLICYEAVYEAEKAGANVSGLLNVLNEAGWLLAKAKLAYNIGDFDSAYECALECSQSLEGTVSQANSLKLEAEQASHMDFLINYMGSAAGSVAVLVGGYAVWLFLRRRETF